MKGVFYVIRRATPNELEKLIVKLANTFDGFLIGSTIFLESGVYEFKQITNNLSINNINKPLIADLKLSYSEKEEIDPIIQTLYDNGLSGITVSGLLSKEIINNYKKYEDFKIYAYLRKIDIPYSITDKILELGETGCDGIILSFNFISEIDPIKEKIKTTMQIYTAMQIYLCVDGDENVVIPLNS